MPDFNWNDTINLLSKLTARRVWNGGKVLSSYYLSKWTKKAVQWGYPVSISFEPTTSCNLRCPECPSGLRSFTRPTGMLQNDFFRDTIDQLSKELLYLIFYFQGEPYLNPAFLDMVAYASGKGIYTATSTNAHYLNDQNAKRTVESGLDRLIISIDGTTQDVYEQYRVGGQLEKVLEGARNIVKWKKELKSKTPFVFFQFLVVKPNEHQLEEIRQTGRRRSAWTRSGSRRHRSMIIRMTPINSSPPTKNIAATGRMRKGNMRSRTTLDNHCWRLWHATVITWDGLVVPCCFDKDAQHPLGDLKGKPFKEIWHNEQYVNFRRQILQSRKNIDICANCSEGTKVWSD